MNSLRNIMNITHLRKYKSRSYVSIFLIIIIKLLSLWKIKITRFNWMKSGKKRTGSIWDSKIINDFYDWSISISVDYVHMRACQCNCALSIIVITVHACLMSRLKCLHSNHRTLAQCTEAFLLSPYHHPQPPRPQRAYSGWCWWMTYLVS